MRVFFVVMTILLGGGAGTVAPRAARQLQPEVEADVEPPAAGFRGSWTADAPTGGTLRTMGVTARAIGP
jgi:hypothetical protein